MRADPADLDLDLSADRTCATHVAAAPADLPRWSDDVLACVASVGYEAKLVIEQIPTDSIDGAPPAAAVTFTRFLGDFSVDQYIADFDSIDDDDPSAWRYRVCDHDPASATAAGFGLVGCSTWEVVLDDPSALRVRLFEPFEFELDPTPGVGAGDSIFLVETGDSYSLRAWTYFGRVEARPDGLVAALNTNTPALWRLESGELGEARPELLLAGDYELMTREWVRLGDITVTGSGDATSFVGPGFAGPTADQVPILRPDGLADVDFGTDRATAVDLLSAWFGEPVEDLYVEGCPSWHVMRWTNGIVAYFDDAGFAEYSFRAFDQVFDPARRDENRWPLEYVERPPFTTAEGVGLGQRLYAGDVVFRGGYDTLWGASTWHLGPNDGDGWPAIGGSLSGDFTDRHSVVVSIDVGRDGTPAGRVC